MEVSLDVRRATPEDYDGVREMTSEIWQDRGGDYLTDYYLRWLEDEDDDHKRTFLAEAGDDVAGLVQAVMLSPDEAWFQGMRVNPEYRRQGISQRLTSACFDWARERGALVGRIMIFSWNVPALSVARSSGYEPVTEFRWAQPGPDADGDGPFSVSTDPTAAWRYWTGCDVRTHLQGLALSTTESWAMAELTPGTLADAAEETAVFAVEGNDGLSGMAYRTREYDQTNDDGESETWAEYGVGAWDDVDSARSLFGAIARDAASLDADRTRVLIPETGEAVSDACFAGAGVSEEPDFVLGADLTVQ